jgi:sigma-B regulation protein RsbU (phosphoserine phosphatase)
VTERAAMEQEALFDCYGLELICPIRKGGRTIAVIGLGARPGGRRYTAEEHGFLRSVAACAATPIENGLIYDELRRLNQRLSLKVFQLHNLFDINRELTASFDEETIRGLVTTTLMGQLMVSRAALYLKGAAGLAAAEERGFRSEEGPISDPASLRVVEALPGPADVGALPTGPLRERLERARLALLIPLRVGSRTEGFLAAGGRASGVPFSEDERDFAMTLARQALASLESVRLHRVEVLKQRQDREMQIAREIQRSLFPSSLPEIPGFELAAVSEPCYEVGGDHYDAIPLAGGRLAIAIADVSGKGAPASILMASVHASLRALAGTAPPAGLMARLNRFLYESTQTNKYVTLFYAELDPRARRLRYVNGGHVPPYHVRRGGEAARLQEGGPALGLLPDADYLEGEVALGSGDLVAMVTDGVTEALSPADQDFGDERALAALQGAADGPAAGVLHALVGGVRGFAGEVGCTDDLTAVVLKAL